MVKSARKPLGKHHHFKRQTKKSAVFLVYTSLDVTLKKMRI